MEQRNHFRCSFSNVGKGGRSMGWERGRWDGRALGDNYISTTSLSGPFAKAGLDRLFQELDDCRKVVVPETDVV